MTRDSAKVSVILPTYNRAKLLPRAVNSVLDQTYQNIELIIVDDCSTDDTENVINNIHDPRIIYIKLENNKGANFARNVGIKNATANLIAFQDSDDEWLPEKLSLQMAQFITRDSHTEVCYCAYQRVNETGDIENRPWNNINPKNGDILKPLLYGNFITTQTAIISKKCFDQVGLFDESLPRYQDWDMFIRLAKHYHFLYVDQALLKAYYTSDSITADHSKLTSAMRLVVKKHKRLFRQYPAIYAKHLIVISLGKRLAFINQLMQKIPTIKHTLRSIIK